MQFHAKSAGIRMAMVALALSASTALVAQQGTPLRADVASQAEPLPDPASMTEGPEIKGVLTARQGDRIQVQTGDGARTVLYVSDATRVRATGGLFGSSRTTLDTGALLNGLPVTIKTVQADGGLYASQVTFKASDQKVAQMIQQGTAQGFAEQSAQTEALRSRMGDIDKYNLKATTSVYFDTGKWALSPSAKTELCAAATEAERNENALLLVVGYTDSVGDEDYNQTLSEKRAWAVINYLQQYCRWKPYRVLTPTGMAESDPLADNSTPEGRAQNRRVSVNVLVSKALDVD